MDEKDVAVEQYARRRCWPRMGVHALHAQEICEVTRAVYVHRDKQKERV